MCDIITGDESWFNHRQIGRKQAKRSRVGKDESPRTVVRQGRFEPKTMFAIFFKQSGVVQITYFDTITTINNESYLESCLKPLVKEICKETGIK